MFNKYDPKVQFTLQMVYFKILIPYFNILVISFYNCIKVMRKANWFLD